MNVYKKTMLALGMTLFITPQAYGDVAQLDETGRNEIFALAKVYQDFIRTLREPGKANLNVERWNSQLKSNIKQYIENHSKVMGIKDSSLMQDLNLLLQANDSLIKAIQAVQLKKTLKESDVEELLKPLERMELALKNVTIPRIEKQTYYVADKKKAQAMLISAFDLLRLMAAAMVKYTAAMIYEK
ncbi:MAG TPA: hypothetical protein VJ201_05305 [Candidatus Babeliales bacterium]|nr:hypothetical protein [Candidatus Babeliales bacterium]